MSLSKFTLGFGLYIILSASYMRQVWEFFSAKFSQKNVAVICGLLFLGVSIWILIYLCQFHLRFLKMLLNLVILSLAFIFAWWQPFFPEKAHTLEYGFLGWFAARDLSKDKNLVTFIPQAIFFVLLVGASDEIFQWFLPYRVGEVRDVVTNIIGGIFGISLFLNTKKNF